MFFKANSSIGAQKDKKVLKKILKTILHNATTNFWERVWEMKIISKSDNYTLELYIRDKGIEIEPSKICGRHFGRNFKWLNFFTGCSTKFTWSIL